MLISRQIDQSICINHQQLLTLHGVVEGRVMIYWEDLGTETSGFEHIDAEHAMNVGEYGTQVCLDSIDENLRIVTFDIQHDPQVVIHRAEAGTMQ
jgi:hypothetical protein